MWKAYDAWGDEGGGVVRGQRRALPSTWSHDVVENSFGKKCFADETRVCCLLDAQAASGSPQLTVNDSNKNSIII